MGINFEQVEFDEIREAVRQHLAEMTAVIDSFLEEYILASRHYRITMDEKAAGFASIHGGSLITQFWLAERFRQFGQAAFWRLRRLEQVQSTFVPTFDEFFLAHALDDYQKLNRQAY